jgi:hypothetical protein
MSLQSKPVGEPSAGDPSELLNSEDASKMEDMGGDAAGSSGGTPSKRQRRKATSAGALVRNPYADTTAKDMVSAVKQGFFGVDRRLVDPAKTKFPSASAAPAQTGPTGRNVIPPRKGKQPGVGLAHQNSTPNPKGWQVRQ